MAVVWLIVALLAVATGSAKMISHHRKGNHDKKYDWLPVTVGGVICTVILLEPFVGPVVMKIAAGLFIAVVALVVLGALGGLLTQLGELFKKPPRK